MTSGCHGYTASILNTNPAGRHQSCECRDAGHITGSLTLTADVCTDNVIECQTEAVLKTRLACRCSPRTSKTTVSSGSSVIDPSCHKLSLRLPFLSIKIDFYRIKTSLQRRPLVRTWSGVRETFISVDSSCTSQPFYQNTDSLLTESTL